MWCFFLNSLTWKCASRHSRVHFFNMSTSKSAPGMGCIVDFDFEMCFAPQLHALFRYVKSVPRMVFFFLNIFTWKCASHHNGVHFFDISTVCFLHFDLEMCFVPQQRAFFRHVNSQKCSENGVHSTFGLGHVLRSITACNRTRRFSEPTFRPSGATNHWKNTVLRDYPTFLRTWIFFLLLSSSFFFFLLLSSSLPLPFSSLLFSSLTVPTSAFPSLHIVGSLTSKLPSAMDLCGNIVR